MVRTLCAPFVLAALMLAFTAGESRAQLRVCNESAEDTIDVALAYDDEGRDWVAAGWYSIERGRCETLLRGDLTNRYYYLFAKGGDLTWESDDDTGREFCVMEDKAFTLYREQYLDAEGALQCATHGYGLRNFVQIDIGENATSYTHTFED